MDKEELPWCEHANENPVKCPCKEHCYCKTRACKGRGLDTRDIGLDLDPLKAVWIATFSNVFVSSNGNVLVSLQRAEDAVEQLIRVYNKAISVGSDDRSPEFAMALRMLNRRIPP